MKKTTKRKVTRTYTRKDGTVVTKVYEYDKKTDSSKKNVITTQGKMSKKMDKILSTLEDAEEREWIKRKIKQFSSQIEDKTRKKKPLSLQKFRTMYAANRINILFSNMGSSVQEIVVELNLKGFDVDEFWILDNSHWDFKGLKRDNPEPTLSLPDGSTATVKFHYEEGYTLDVNERQTTSEDVED